MRDHNDDGSPFLGIIVALAFMAVVVGLALLVSALN